MLELSVGFQMRSKALEVVFCVPSLIKTDLLGSVRLAWSLDPRHHRQDKRRAAKYAFYT